MKSSTGIVVVVVVVLLIILGVIAFNQNPDEDSLNLGSLYVSVTDATADINAVTDVDMEINKVEIYNDAEGWVTVSNNSETYALLALKASGQEKLYGKKDNVQTGVYNKVRVTLGDTTVRTKTSGNVKAVLPAEMIEINTTAKIRSNESTVVKLDFLADKSLHVTSDNKYVFAPVVNSETRSGVTVSEQNDTVTSTGGTVDANTTAGVDLSGVSKVNFQLNTTGDLKINTATDGAISFVLNGTTYNKSDVSVNPDGTTSEDDVNLEGKGVLDTEIDVNNLLK